MLGEARQRLVTVTMLEGEVAGASPAVIAADDFFDGARVDGGISATLGNESTETEGTATTGSVSCAASLGGTTAIGDATADGAMTGGASTPDERWMLTPTSASAAHVDPRRSDSLPVPLRAVADTGDVVPASCEYAVWILERMRSAPSFVSSY